MKCWLRPDLVQCFTFSFSWYDQINFRENNVFSWKMDKKWSHKKIEIYPLKLLTIFFFFWSNLWRLGRYVGIKVGLLFKTKHIDNKLSLIFFLVIWYLIFVRYYFSYIALVVSYSFVKCWILLSVILLTLFLHLFFQFILVSFCHILIIINYSMFLIPVYIFFPSCDSLFYPLHCCFYFLIFCLICLSFFNFLLLKLFWFITYCSLLLCMFYLILVCYSFPLFFYPLS